MAGSISRALAVAALLAATRTPLAKGIKARDEPAPPAIDLKGLGAYGYQSIYNGARTHTGAAQIKRRSRKARNHARAKRDGSYRGARR